MPCLRTSSNGTSYAQADARRGSISGYVPSSVKWRGRWSSSSRCRRWAGRGTGLRPKGITQFAQPESALLMIRLLASPFGAIMLSGVVLFTALFPLARERYERIQRLLERRRARMAE
ncbi:MAG: hypothetical protein MZV64_00290 [Ignavibacteriales bacterium]|nr:hypothetical protein [Ignavibacteriales bacterium]